MGKWSWYCTGLIIIIGILILGIAMKTENFKNEKEPEVFFFKKTLPSAEGDASELVLRCPPSGSETSGKKGLEIEILSAYFDVFDPWGQCTPEPSDLIAKTCGKDAAGHQGMCSNLVQMTEPDNGAESQWYRNKICGSRYQDANGRHGNNTEPYGGSDYVCRIQDATPFLAARCTGEKECIVNLSNPNEVGQVFGSLPCYNETTEIPLRVGADDYKRLPSDKKGGEDSSFQQGYLVKGAFRCVPAK